MKKVMIVANNDVGLYKFRLELVEELLKHYEVHIVLPYGNFVDDLISLGCVFHHTDLQRRGTNPLSDYSLYNNYKKIIGNIHPDIVFTYTIKPNIYAGLVCAKLNIPYVANITGLGTAVENKGILQIITINLYKIALRKAQKVFFQNFDNYIFMRNKKIINNNYDILPGSGVNLSFYEPLPYPNADTVNFLFIARVMKEKGIDQFLNAADYITKKYPNTNFHICGACEDSYENILKQKIKSGSIIYHGLVKDMRPFYEMSSCTIHPTYYPEGMSNVLLESSACARPIITTNRSGCREVIDDNVNGFIVKEQDSIDLIEKIEKFLSLSFKERENMGLAGRKKVEKEFDRNYIVNKYMEETFIK